MKDVNGNDINIYNDCFSVLRKFVEIPVGDSTEWNALNIIEKKFIEMRFQISERTAIPQQPQAGSEASPKPCGFCFNLVYLDDTRKNNRCPVCCKKIRTASAVR